MSLFLKKKTKFPSQGSGIRHDSFSDRGERTDSRTLTKYIETDELLTARVSSLLYYSPALNLPGEAGRYGPIWGKVPPSLPGEAGYGPIWGKASQPPWGGWEVRTDMGKGIWYLPASGPLERNGPKRNGPLERSLGPLERPLEWECDVALSSSTYPDSMTPKSQWLSQIQVEPFSSSSCLSPSRVVC